MEPQRDLEDILADLIRLQEELPPEWKDPAYYELDAPEDFRSIEEVLGLHAFDPVSEHAGSEPELYPSDELEKLRAEWPD